MIDAPTLPHGMSDDLPAPFRPKAVDRTGWPRGEWDDEPDFEAWTDERTGLDLIQGLPRLHARALGEKALANEATDLRPDFGFRVRRRASGQLGTQRDRLGLYDLHHHLRYRTRLGLARVPAGSEGGKDAERGASADRGRT